LDNITQTMNTCRLLLPHCNIPRAGDSKHTTNQHSERAGKTGNKAVVGARFEDRVGRIGHPNCTLQHMVSAVNTRSCSYHHGETLPSSLVILSLRLSHVHYAGYNCPIVAEVFSNAMLAKLPAITGMTLPADPMSRNTSFRS